MDSRKARKAGAQDRAGQAGGILVSFTKAFIHLLPYGSGRCNPKPGAVSERMLPLEPLERKLLSLFSCHRQGAAYTD